MEASQLKDYQVVFTKEYTTVSAANRAVKQYEEKHGKQNTQSGRKQFLVEKMGTGEYTMTLFNLRKKIK